MVAVQKWTSPECQQGESDADFQSCDKKTRSAWLGLSSYGIIYEPSRFCTRLRTGTVLDTKVKVYASCWFVAYLSCVCQRIGTKSKMHSLDTKVNAYASHWCHASE